MLQSMCIEQRALNASAPVAQWIESLTSNQKAVGSSPAGRACTMDKPKLERLKEPLNAFRQNELSAGVGFPYPMLTLVKTLDLMHQI
jgi:hypothetical protein